MGGNWHSCTPVPALPTQEDVSTRSIRGRLNPPWVKFLREGWTSEPRQEARVSYPSWTQAVFLNDLIPDLPGLPSVKKGTLLLGSAIGLDPDSTEKGQEQGAKVAGSGRSLYKLQDGQGRGQLH